jgi:hypothetical protein
MIRALLAAGTSLAPTELEKWFHGLICTSTSRL